MLPLPTVMVCRGLTLPDPERCEHQFLGSAGAHHLTELCIYPTERAEESRSSLGKMFVYKVNNCALAGSVAAEELGWK